MVGKMVRIRSLLLQGSGGITILVFSTLRIRGRVCEGAQGEFVRLSDRNGAIPNPHSGSMTLEDTRWSEH